MRFKGAMSIGLATFLFLSCSSQQEEASSKPLTPVEIRLKSDGSQKFASFTSQHIGEMAAILVEGEVVSAPVIRAEISGGRAMISGDFTEAEAKALAESIVPGQ